MIKQNARMWSTQLAIKVRIAYCHSPSIRCSDFLIVNYNGANQTESPLLRLFCRKCEVEFLSSQQQDRHDECPAEKLLRRELALGGRVSYGRMR